MTDRLFWVGLARAWTGWPQFLVIVPPATVQRWQRRRFREHWTQLSGRPTGGRQAVNTEITALVRKMRRIPVGCPRIHGELLKLGLDVAERSLLLTRAQEARRFPAERREIIGVESAKRHYVQGAKGPRV